MNKDKQKLKKRNGIMNLLKNRYGIEEDDAEKIMNVLNEEYDVADISGKEYDYDENAERIRFLEEENKSIRKQFEEALSKRKMESTINAWLGDANTLKDEFEDFDLEKEAENPVFQNLLRGGIDLKTAYYAMHHKDILENAVKKAVEDARLKITDSIRARGTRPGENGLSDKSTATLKKDVSRLTPEERELIAARVHRGEKISF